MTSRLAPSAATRLAQQQIDDFRRQCGGDAALHLAYHAALPVALNAELLHLLRVNFFLDPPEPLPYTIEFEFLLSPLCRVIDEGLYEIEPTIRDLLLQGLTQQYDAERIRDIATLLWQYVDRHSAWADRAELERAQQLTALNFLDPDKAQQWLDASENSLGASSPADREWFIAMRQELETQGQLRLESNQINIQNLIRQLSETQTGNFFDLAAIAGLNPLTDFAGANLQGVDLTNAELSEADLAGADLSGANLTNANLVGTNLTGADLSNTKLNGANLRGAALQQANMRFARLIGANLQNARSVDADFRHANLSDANLGNANLEGANLLGANLEGADMSGTHLNRAHLTQANLKGVNFTRTSFRRAIVENASFKDNIGLSIKTIAYLKERGAIVHDVLEDTDEAVTDDSWIDSAAATRQSPTAKDFFVSYSRADKQWAEWIAWTLEEAGYSVVIPARDFRPGGNFVLDMQRAAAESQKTIAVLSESYLQSSFTQPEWAAAIADDPQGLERKLIPVRVKECKPEGILRSIVYVDLVGLSEAEAARAVLTATGDRLKREQKPAFLGSEERITGATPLFPGTTAPQMKPKLNQYLQTKRVETQQLLADLANDYETTAKELDRTIDALEKIYLQRELEALAQEMDNLANQLDEIEQQLQ